MRFLPTPPDDRARVVAAGSVVVALAAVLAVLAGCASTAGTSSCTPPSDAPQTLSGVDRRDPVVATDGGAGAVAAWESNTGGPIEASLRSGSWSTSTPISRDGARDPSVAMSPGGAAVAVWQWQPVGGARTIEVATNRADGTWTAPATLSAPQASARDPQVAVDGSGHATAVWRRDTDGDHAVVEVAEQDANGRWGMPHAVSAGEVRARRPRLAVAPDGAAAAVWEQRVDGTQGVAVATRSVGGAWSAPSVVSTGVRSTQEPDVAIGPLGAAVAVWIGRDSAGIGVFAATNDGQTGWSTPVPIGRGDDRPRELSRPGRADTGADIAMLPDGRPVAVWTLVQGGANRLGLAIGDGAGRWAALPVPGAGGPAGGAQVVPAAGGGALVTWEELDGGLIRARSEAVDPDGGTGCRDLSAGRSETGGVRPAGGSAPIAVFVDLNRGRVEVADLP